MADTIGADSLAANPLTAGVEAGLLPQPCTLWNQKYVDLAPDPLFRETLAVAATMAASLPH